MTLCLFPWFRHQQLDRGDPPSALCAQGGALPHHHGYSWSPPFLRRGWRRRRGHGPGLRQQNSAGVRRRRQWGQLLLRPDDCRCGGTARCYLKRVSQRWILTPWLDVKLFQHPHIALYYLYSYSLSFFFCWMMPFLFQFLGFYTFSVGKCAFSASVGTFWAFFWIQSSITIFKYKHFQILPM